LKSKRIAKEMAQKGKLLIVSILACTAKIAVGQDEHPVLYEGRVPCPSNSSLMGYTNTTLLNDDIVLDMKHVYTGGVIPDFFHYILCPDTTFKIESQMEGAIIEGDSPIIPGLSNSLFTCGEEGNSEDNCIMEGGYFHFYFPDFVIADQVYVSGITFSSSKGASVYGDAHPSTHVVFIDCHWKYNVGTSTVYIHYTPSEDEDRALEKVKPYNMDEMKEIMRKDAHALTTVQSRDLLNLHYTPDDNEERAREKAESYDTDEKKEIMRKDTRALTTLHSRDLQTFFKYSMSCVFVDSSFIKNEDIIATIFNRGGAVELIGTEFVENNVAELAIFSVLEGGHSFIHEQTVFKENFARLGPVYIANGSNLHLSRDNSGMSNTGSQCDGIFLEDSTSKCFDIEEQCTGECCIFGDESCDLYTEDLPSVSPSTSAPTRSPVTPPSQLSRPTSPVSSISSSVSNEERGRCTGYCLAFTSLISAVLVIAVLVGFFILRRRKLNKGREITVTSELESSNDFEDPPALNAQIS